MSTKKEALKKRVRETITGLPDDVLINMIENSPLSYTPYALRVAREELAKRKKMQSLRKDIAALRNPEGDQPQAGEGKQNLTGCYIELWRDKNFEGDHLIIEGPAEYAALSSDDKKWGDDICSLRVGPNAFVMAYENDGFAGEIICFGPGQEVADLGEFKFDDEIESLKLISSVKIFEYSRRAGGQEAWLPGDKIR